MHSRIKKKKKKERNYNVYISRILRIWCGILLNEIKMTVYLSMRILFKVASYCIEMTNNRQKARLGRTPLPEQ